MEPEETTESPLVEILSQNVTRLSSFLQVPEAPTADLDTSFGQRLAPLGNLRLMVIELIYQMVRLNKNIILDALVETDVFSQMSKMIELYPWNNFL
jgi:hypothetical protein